MALTTNYRDGTDKNSRMKVRVVVFARSLWTQYAFPFQSRILEIYEKGQVQARDVQIPNHLRNMRIGEAGDHFGINDYCVIDNQIGNKVTNKFRAIVNRIRA